MSPTTETQATSDLNKTGANSILSSLTVPQSSRSPAQAPPGFRLSSLDATHYILKASTFDNASIAFLEDVQGSVIDITLPPAITTSFATLMANKIHDSLLMCGTIAGSAHITDIRDSTIVITARQLRVHKCENVVIYLQCSSRPIIEDCKEVRFAPLPETLVRLPYIETLWEMLANEWDCQITEESIVQPNLWNQVDDFKWLRPEPSPNWSVLESDDIRAIAEESWKSILNEEHQSLNLNKLLQIARLK